MSDSLVGVVPTDWELTTLGEVCARGGGDIQTGPFGSQLHASDYVPVGVPSITPQNISDNRIATDGIARISEADANRLRRYLVRLGDIVYSRRGDVERRALVREEQDGWLCGTGCLRVRLGEGVVDPRFAAFYLAHPAVRAWIVQHAVGATMPNLNTAILSAVPFAVPPLAEQRRISDILGALDDKIELNRSMNRTLESTARAIFKSWFVDFDPVRTKAEGGDGGLPPDLAALFPSNFATSRIGLVPKGWPIEPLDKIAHFLNGLALQKFPPTGENDLPAIKGAELTRGVTSSSGKASRELPLEFVVKQGDVLFSWSGSLNCVVWSDGEGALNQHVFKVTSLDFPAWFVFHWIQEHLPAFRDIAADKATTMGHIKRGHLSDAVVVVPTNEVLAAADAVMSPIESRSIAANVESRRLEGMRDALLPQLIGGHELVRSEGV